MTKTVYKMFWWRILRKQNLMAKTEQKMFGEGKDAKPND